MIVNLRFVIFAAAIGPHFAHLPWYRRIWHGYFNADVTMALFPQRFPPETLYQTQASLASSTASAIRTGVAWQAGSVAGILLAGQIPAELGIGFAGTLALLAVTIPLTINVAALAGVAAASIVAVRRRRCLIDWGCCSPSSSASVPRWSLISVR